jgi:hypothetical protein
VPTEAAKIIESLQPYNSPNATAAHEHILWRLNKLCIIDKHMRIPVLGVTGTVTWDTFVPFGTRDFKVIEFDDHSEMRIPLSRKGEVGLNPRILECKVLFGDLYWKIQCDFAEVEAIYEFDANSVIPRFTRFFQQVVSRSAGG